MIEDKWVEGIVDEYREVVKVLNEYITEEDGTNLIPNEVRVRNMLERLTNENNQD